MFRIAVWGISCQILLTEPCGVTGWNLSTCPSRIQGCLEVLRSLRSRNKLTPMQPRPIPPPLPSSQPPSNLPNKNGNALLLTVGLPKIVVFLFIFLKKEEQPNRWLKKRHPQIKPGQTNLLFWGLVMLRRKEQPRPAKSEDSLRASGHAKLGVGIQIQKIPGQMCFSRPF